MSRESDGRGPGADARARAAEEQQRQALREVEHAILARTPEHDLTPSLDRIAAVCDLLGNPQHAYRVVHLTGTNGKTSTTRMVERLVREHGLRTGRFVSPHLSSVRERISIDGEPLDPQRFVEVYRDVEPYLELVDARSAEQGQPRLSFFEVLVAMAFAAFADAPVDVAVVEVGMGGTWDATNVADGEVAVVTPVAIDHERFLGHDLASIATEKSGIIKPGATAVLAEQDPEAAEVLLHRAGQVGASLALEGRDFGVLDRQVAVGGQQLRLKGVGDTYEEVFLPLFGEHQARNAACALAAAEVLLGARDRGLDPDVVRAAFADVDSPGRLEVVRRSPTIVVDAAHNPAGAQSLADSLGESFAFSRVVGVVAVLADKDAAGILEALQPVLDAVVVTRTLSPRAYPVAELGEIAREFFDDDQVVEMERLDLALDTAVTLAEGAGLPGAGVLATGSITLVAEVRTLFGLT